MNTARRTIFGFLVLVSCMVLGVAAALAYMTSMPAHSYSGSLSPLTPDENQIEKQLQVHVGRLSGQIGERNTERYQALNSAADYIQRTLQAYGYPVSSQAFSSSGRSVRNLAVQLAGNKLQGERIVVGAHYDSAIGTPGANDNATGVAALLELARLLAHSRLDRSLEFIFFTNEEPPYFRTGEMGSLVYARALRKDNVRVLAMISLETIGSYSDARNSQHYPAGFGALYPDTGNFITFVGDTSSRKLVRCVVNSFRRSAKFPSEGVAAPASLPGIGWSDHWSFWQQGYPALMVTDTAPFRYRYYHHALDTPDKVDFDRMARVVAGLRVVVTDLAGSSNCFPEKIKADKGYKDAMWSDLRGAQYRTTPEDSRVQHRPLQPYRATTFFN